MQSKPIQDYHTFSSFRVPLRQSTIVGNKEDEQIVDGLYRNKEEIVSTEPCLGGQLGELARIDSS